MKRWYVAQVYAGFEEDSRLHLLRKIHESGLENSFGDILIPSAKVKTMFDAASQQQDQQLFPGYLFIQMEMNPEAAQLVLSIPRIYKFLGGRNPVPVSESEIGVIKSQVSQEVVVLGPEVDGVEVGTEVGIEDGPFAGFVGVVEKVDKENEKLTVMVSIFGRMTPVELGFHQIKR